MTERLEISGLKEFTIQCLTNRWTDGGTTADIIKEHWKNAENLDAFKAAVFEDSRLKTTQAYAELSKEDADHWYRVREMFGARCIKTTSDAGGVKVGNEIFAANIENGIGDGTTRLAVFAKGDEFNENMMRYSGITLKGKFSIYDYDCGGVAIEELDGNYAVYNYDGLVAFVEF